MTKKSLTSRHALRSVEEALSQLSFGQVMELDALLRAPMPAEERAEALDKFTSRVVEATCAAAAPDEVNIMVCVYVPDGKSPFTDNVQTACAECKTPITHRPFVPVTFTKLCMACAGSLVEAQEKGEQ